MQSLGKLTILIMMVSLSNYSLGQVNSIPISQLTDSIRQHPKASLILISTSWCSYCQMQKAQLQKNKNFQSASPYLYFSELDAENPDDITFNGKTYSFKRTGANTGQHELAYTLGNIDHRLAYPTWVLIDQHFEILFKYPGVLDKQTLNQLLDSIRAHRH